jgi:hypothetical protein
MHDPQSFAAFAACIYAAAVVAGPLLRAGRAASAAALAVASGSILALPILLGGSQSPFFRFLMAVMAFELTAKMFDYGRYRPEPGTPDPTFRDYLAFLVPFPSLTPTFLPHRRRPGSSLPRRLEPFRVLAGLAGLGAGVVLVRVYLRSGLGETSFAVDHIALFVAFIILIESGCHVTYGIERLAGLRAPPVMNFAFLARTPADFWRRYNLRVGAWLHRHVFLPAGGRRRIAPAVLLTFLVSGLVHEYVFAVATQHIHGYQMAFFLLQGLGVLGSGLLNRTARTYGLAGTIAAHALTILFMLLTSTFFFASCHRILPGLYRADPWLP